MPGGIEARRRPRAASAPRRTGASAAGGPRRGRRRSRRRASARARRRACPRGRRSGPRRGRARGTRTIGTPAPVISRIPTARRWRLDPGGAGRERRAQDLEAERAPAQRLRELHAAVRGDRQRRRRGAVAASAHERRPADGLARRLQAQLAARSRGAAASTRATPCARRATSRSTTAASRRTRSRPGSPAGPRSGPRTRTSRRARPPSASIALSGARASTVPQPSAVHARAAGGAICRSSPRSPSWRSRTSTAPAVPRRGSRRNGSSPAVRSNRYVRPVRVEVAARERALGEHRRPQRLAHPHAGDAQLADPAGALRHVLGRAARARSAPAASARRAGRAGAGSSPACTGNVRPATSTAVTFARRSEYGSSSIASTSRGRVEADLEPVARLLERAVGLPVRRRVAVEGRERPPLGELRVGGRERHAQVARAVVDRDGLPVGAARREQVQHRRVGRERVVGGERRAVVLRHPRGREHAPAVGVGDHDLAAPGAARPRRRVARVGDPPARQRAERGQAGERVGAAVDHRRARVGLDAHQRPRARAVPGAHARQRRARRRACRPRAARAAPAPRPRRARRAGRARRRRRRRRPRRCASGRRRRPRPPCAPTAGRAAGRAGRAARAAAARARRPSRAGRPSAGRRRAPRSARPPAGRPARAGSRRPSRPSRSTRRAARAARPRGRRPPRSRRRGRPPRSTRAGCGPRSAASRAPGRARAASTPPRRARRARQRATGARGRGRAATAPPGRPQPARQASASASSGPAL